MFSVIIPLYNKAHTIVQTVHTVLNQSYPHFEIIIVNDGSTDRIEDVLSDFIQDPRVQIFSQENQGVSVARNNGILFSKYEYLAFLDGDDEWHPDYLFTMQKAITEFPENDMFCCAGIIKNGDGKQYVRLAEKYKNKILEIDFFENPHVFLHTSATIISRKIAFKSKFFPVGMKRNQDYAFFFSIALLGSVVYCGIPLSIYVGGVEGQATHTDINKVLIHVANRFNHVISNYLEIGRFNKNFEIFTKYELRHFFIGQLRKGDYDSLNFLIKNIDFRNLQLFSPFELQMLRNKSFRKLSIIYLIGTKIRWRLREYPRINY